MKINDLEEVDLQKTIQHYESLNTYKEMNQFKKNPNRT